MERGPLGANDAVVVLRGIARAVDGAHAQRLAHGALKPQNVFVAPAPQRAVRVTDFGLAVARAALPTNEGFAIAAPWMAPEQMHGSPGGPAADVFSAALVAFYAATGKSYWRSCQGPAPDLAGWQAEIAAPRVPPSARARELGANLPPAFDAPLGRALSQNPAERFGSVGELAEALGKTSGAAQKMAMTMPLTAMPQAAQDMLRQVAAQRAPAATPRGAPPYGGGGGGASTLAISSPLDMPFPGQGAQPAPPQQPPVPVQQVPQMQQPPPQPMQQPMPQAPYGGFQGGSPGPAPMGQPVQSFAPPPESVAVPKSRGGLVIVLALVGLVVLAAAVVVVVVLRQRAVVASLPPEATAEPTQSTPASAAAATAPAASTAAAAAAAPVETQDAATPVEATGDAGAAALAAAGAEGGAPDQAELTIVCVPDCDAVKVDDKALDTTDAGLVPTEPMQVAVGPHTIAVGKATYMGQTRKVTLKPGQKSKETFFMTKPGAVAVPKPCGKFLERCPN